MQITLKKSLATLAMLGLALAAALPAPSHAQAYPSRTIAFVVPYTPGTTADVLARILGAKISERWKVPVVVENRTGAAGMIGTESASKAAPDGYTILFAATSYGTLAAVNPKLPYDALKSFAPISLLGTSAMTLVTSNKFPAANLKEFVEQVKKQPGVFNYASPGTGGSQHLAMELFKQQAGIDIVHVPYRGTAGAMNDLVANHVQASVVSLQTATPFVQNGKLRMLATMGRERAPNLPQVPTMAQAGFGNVVVETWYGVMAPAGTPATVVNKLSDEIDQLLKLPELKEAMAKQGVDPVGGKPEKLAELLRNEVKLWTEVATRGKIALD